MEQAGDQGRTQNVAHLLAPHARLQRLHLLTRDEVSLDDINLVGCYNTDHTAGSAVKAAAGGQYGARQQGQTQTGTAIGFGGHEKRRRAMISPL